MANKQLVLAFFDNEDAADEAVEALKQWDKGTKDIELGAIGVLVKNEKGKIKTHKLGKRKTGTGAVLFALAGLLSGGLSVIGGAVLGGILGSFFHKGLGISKDDLARIDGELDGGRVAVGVLVEPNDSTMVTNRLADLGGESETHEVTEEALDHVETAAEEAPEEEVIEAE